MEQAQKTKEESIVDAARVVRRKIAFLLRKPIIRQYEVYRLSKEFFKAYLQHDYEFTMEELRRELHKVYLSSIVRERVESLIEKLSLLEYTDTEYSQAELQLLLHDLDTIIKNLVTEHKRQLPWLTRFANWLFRKRPTGARPVISEYPALEPQDPVSIELKTLAEKIYRALDDGDTKRAARYYTKLLNKYNMLGTTAQEAFYHTVNEAYKAIIKQKK